MPENNAACPLHKTSVGGQALIEGIMMQGPKGAAVAVRIPDGSIDVTDALMILRCAMGLIDSFSIDR